MSLNPAETEAALQQARNHVATLVGANNRGALLEQNSTGYWQREAASLIKLLLGLVLWLVRCELERATLAYSDARRGR